MKKIYIAPKAEVICFAPVESLADSYWEQNYALGSSNSNVSITIPNPVPNPTEENGEIE